MFSVSKSRGLFLFSAALFLFTIDQLTKSVVRSELLLGQAWPSDDWLVKIVHGTNSGAAFGILQNQGPLLAIIAAIAIIAIPVFYFFYADNRSPILPIALGLQVGGALGNLTDRLRNGHVTDLISFPNYPSFNMADSGIVVGLLLMVGLIYWQDRHSQKPQTESKLNEGRQ